MLPDPQHLGPAAPRILAVLMGVRWRLLVLLGVSRTTCDTEPSPLRIKSFAGRLFAERGCLRDWDIGHLSRAGWGP